MLPVLAGETEVGIVANWRSLLGPVLTEEIIAQAHSDVEAGLHKQRNGMARCLGQDCSRHAIAGASYCTEDHYEELVAERKARNGYRTNYTPTLPPGEERPKPAVVHGVSRPAKKAVPAPKPVIEERKRGPKSPDERKSMAEDVSRLHRNGISNAQISSQLGIARSTVEYYVRGAVIVAQEAETLMPVTAMPVKPELDLPNVRLKQDSPYDAVIADLKARQDKLGDAIKLLEALRDGGV